MSNERTVAITRIFDAPRERVFAAWTQAEHLAHWFGPKGFSVPSCESDPRPGGVFTLCMRSPEGKAYWIRGVYREVVAPERLVIAGTADDENGIQRLQTVIDVTFAKQGSKTKLTLRATAGGTSIEATAMLEGMTDGWMQSVERLAAHLAGRQTKVNRKS